MTNLLLKSLVAAAFLMLFFANLPGYGTVAMGGGISILTAASFSALFFKKVNRVPAGMLEILLSLAALISLAINLFEGNEYSAVFTIIFLFALAASMLLSRAMNFGSLLSALSASYLIIILVIISTDTSNYLLGLTGQSSRETGLLRFRPLGLHPNLAGFVFGAGAIVLWARGKQFQGAMRFLYWSCSIISLSFVLAASARAGLAAFIGSVLIARLIGLRSISLKAVLVSCITCIGIAVILSIWTPYIFGYLARVLDLESSTRGLESGGTGRLDIWASGAAYILNRDFGPLLVGSGMRSSSPEDIGFSTENSYITILIEQGIIVGTLILILIGFSAVFLARRNDECSRIAGTLLLFALIQSIFNRYLLAIGNPFSLFVLLIMTGVLRKDYREWYSSADTIDADLKKSNFT